MSASWLGIDLGGTSIKIVLMTDGAVIDRATTPTIRGQAAATVDQLARAAREWVTRHPGIGGIGVTLPGLFDEAGRAVLLPNVPGQWAGVPILGPVRAASGRAVTLMNDARAFGLAEANLGAARGARTAVGIVLGTGVGGVVILNGRLHLGSAGGAGEIGHQVLAVDGPPCGCGNRGCLEALARSDVVAAAAGQVSVEQAARAADDGDARAIEALAVAGGHLGHGLANVVTVLQPEVVVVGGGIAAAGDLVMSPLRAALRRLTPLVDPASYRVTLAELGPWSGSIGAALAASSLAGT